MKSEEYFHNKNNEIINKSVLVSLQIPRAAKNGDRAMDQLRINVLQFISLAPDLSDGYTDSTWVSCWKSVYNRISEEIRDVKNIGDYRLDAKRRELSAIASALLPARRAVFWVE